MATIQDFIDIINEFIIFFESLKDIEQEKFNAVTAKNFSQIDECMKKEQAAILKLKGLDKKREQIQEKLSFKDKSFREIISLVPDKNKPVLSELFNKLDSNVKSYKSISDAAKETLELNIHNIDRIIDAIENSSTYTNDGSKKENTQKKSFTSRRV